MNLVVTGGGTGGHIFAGVAIAQEFLNQSKANKALFVGADNGLETRLVPKAGLPLETLALGKLVGQSFFERIKTLIQLPIAICKCIGILRRFKANLVVGVGGYAAGPCIIAARLLRIPVGVLEQNSVMGFTNKVSAALAQHVFLAFNEVPAGAPASKCLVTGNPARSQMKPAAVKPQKPFTIFAFGGSQGANGINRIMLELAVELKDLGDDVKFVHQTGPKEFESVKAEYEKLGIAAEVYSFIDDMQSMYNRASIVVCRAGSGTISELGATRNAAIFVPFPFAAGNHQEVNARLVEKVGGGRVFLQAKSNGPNVGKEVAKVIRELKSNPAQLEAMREAIAQFYRPDSAQRIVDVMKTHVLAGSL